MCVVVAASIAEAEYVVDKKNVEISYINIDPFFVKKNIPITFLFLSLTLLPVVAGFIYAVLYSFGMIGYGAKGWTSQYFLALFSSTIFLRSFLMTLWTAGLTVLIAVSGGIFLSSTKQHKLLYVPLAIPALVMAFFVFFFLGNAGFLARFLLKIGLLSSADSFPNLVQDQWGIGIVFAQICMATPFFALLFAQIRKNENIASFEQLSKNLGASSRQVFRKVRLPMLLLRARNAILVYFLFAFGSYEIPLVLGSQSRPMLSVLTVKKLQKFNLADIPQAYAICVLYVLLALLFLYVMRRRLAAF